MNFEKLKAAIMPTFLAVLAWAHTPAGVATLAPWPYAVPVLGFLAAIAHAGDTLTDPSDWR